MLSATGTALAGLSVGTASVRAGGKSSSNGKSLYDIGLSLRDKHDWSNSEWRSFLSKKGMDHTHSSVEIPVSKGGTERNDPGTQKMDQSKLRFYLTYTYSPDITQPQYDAIDFEWEFVYGDELPYGESPYDLCTIEWEQGKYNYGGLYYDNDWCREVKNGDTSGVTGAAVEYDDGAHTNYIIGDAVNNDPDNYNQASYMGLSVEQESGSASDNDIDFDYWHSWENTYFNVSIGTGGVSVSPQSGTNWWSESKVVQVEDID